MLAFLHPDQGRRAVATEHHEPAYDTEGRLNEDGLRATL